VERPGRDLIAISAASAGAALAVVLLAATAAAGATVRANAGHARTPAPQIPIASNITSGWTVQKPKRTKSKRVAVAEQNILWSDPIGSSSWIAPAPEYGVVNKRGGLYTYTYTFCKAVPSLGAPFIFISVLADNAFDARLNGIGFDPTPFLNNGSGAPFQIPQTVSTSYYFSQTHPNVLTIIVLNGKDSPTGADVSGHVQGVAASC
jgi:hypothetical protein